MDPEETEYYQSLNDNEKDEFLTQLKLDLARVVPADPDQLGKIRCKVLDSVAFCDLPIKANQKNIVSDLDSLIREKDLTQISRVNTTRYLDPSVGFQTKSEYNYYYYYFV